MTIRAPEGDTIPSLEPALAGSLAEVPLQLPRERGAWTYMARPDKLRCLHGHVLPALASIYHREGLNGNARDPGGKGEGAIAARMQEGWTPISHLLECVAFGVARPAGTRPSTYLNVYRGLVGKAKADYWCDAWTRPHVVGRMVRWERDDVGWVDFLGRCLRVVWDKPLDRVQVESATAPLIRQVRLAIPRETATARATVALGLLHLPEAFVPRDLREAWDTVHAGDVVLPPEPEPVAPSVPSVAELRERLAAGDLDDVLDALLYTETRKTAKAAIAARIRELHEAPT